VNELDALVSQWLTVPDVCDLTGADVGQVRRMLQEGQLFGIRRGERNILSIPADLVTEQGPLLELPGTMSVLADAGLDLAASLRWLFTPDPTLTGGSAVGALRAGHKTEVRRRAQALAF
jgi:hypothetical protein